MTGGVAIILGETGRNFAAGMSGGFAFVLDEQDRFRKLVNPEMVDLVPLESGDVELVKKYVRRHQQYTGSEKAKYVLQHWDQLQSKFVKVFPRDYRRALAELKKDDDMNGPGNGVSHG